MTREQRLELLKQIEKDIHVCSLESTLLDDAKSCAIHSAIEELEQEPKTGHWIPRNSFLLQYKCSECGQESEKYNFCPNCGADMRGEEE